MNKQLTVTLRGYGNPDYRQYVDIAPMRKEPASDLKDAVRICIDYIRHWYLGGGNWGTQSGVVRDSKGKKIARISFNGRVWAMDGKEIVV